MTVCGFVRNSI